MDRTYRSPSPLMPNPHDWKGFARQKAKHPQLWAVDGEESEPEDLRLARSKLVQRFEGNEIKKLRFLPGIQPEVKRDVVDMNWVMSKYALALNILTNKDPLITRFVEFNRWVRNMCQDEERPRRIDVIRLWEKTTNKALNSILLESDFPRTAHFLPSNDLSRRRKISKETDQVAVKMEEASEAEQEQIAEKGHAEQAVGSSAHEKQPKEDEESFHLRRIPPGWTRTEDCPGCFPPEFISYNPRHSVKCVQRQTELWQRADSSYISKLAETKSMKAAARERTQETVREQLQTALDNSKTSKSQIEYYWELFLIALSVDTNRWVGGRAAFRLVMDEIKNQLPDIVNQVGKVAESAVPFLIETIVDAMMADFQGKKLNSWRIFIIRALLELGYCEPLLVQLCKAYLIPSYSYDRDIDLETMREMARVSRRRSKAISAKLSRKGPEGEAKTWTLKSEEGGGGR